MGSGRGKAHGGGDGPGTGHGGIDLVILDCDGVLVDSETISASVLVDLARSQGIALDAAYVAEWCLGRSFPTVARRIAQDFRVALPPDFETSYRARLLDRFTQELEPTPGAADLLRRLRRPHCVATSSSPPRAAHSLAVTGLAPLVGPVFTASEVARGKPEPDLFLHAAARMGADPRRCLVVEDSQPGLAAARAAGMACALYLGGGHHRGAAARPVAPGPGVTSVADWDGFLAAYPDLVAPVAVAARPAAEAPA